jgi:two-component system chemotaxis response regulator CheB
MQLVIFITDIGGPPALHEILSQLPEEFGLPVVVVPSLDDGILGLSAAALEHTIALKVEQLEDSTLLRAGAVYFAQPRSAYQPVRSDAGVRTRLIGDSHAHALVGQTLENFAQTYQDQIIVVLLSGRGREDEVARACSFLADYGSTIIVLDRHESLVFDMGGAVLHQVPASSELTASEIVELLLDRGIEPKAKEEDSKSIIID